ncbi:hypothetical protein [Salinibacterium sp. PAMC 21357]|uniref:hypothetical protein n=1 Tax=Salinibacterium sp. PAMC 21357 TaxID=1112215 RepID=UPI000288A8C4|nr:hypothetical protein [Salinibacterium sp. PAMC 21357]
MATGSKNIDPRFDPAFQRGYTEGQQGAHSDAVRAANTVDALRDDVAGSQYSRPQQQPRQGSVPAPSPAPGVSASVGAPAPAPAPATRTADAGFAPTTQSNGGQESPTDTHVMGQNGLAPQSHYVDDAGSLAEIVPDARVKSFVRNPWIWVLWIVGVLGLVFGAGIQVWTYAVYYRSNSPSLGNFDWVQALQAVSPYLTQLGAMSVGFALLVHALNWMRKNP